MKLIVEEHGRQVTYELAESGVPATIGRGLDNLVPVRDPLASRRHCQVRVAPDGAVIAEDLGSKNGTLLNGSPFKMRALRPGDCIQIGEVRIWFMERREVLAAAPPPPPGASPPPVPDGLDRTAISPEAGAARPGPAPAGAAAAGPAEETRRRAKGETGAGPFAETAKTQVGVPGWLVETSRPAGAPPPAAAPAAAPGPAAAAGPAAAPSAGGRAPYDPRALTTPLPALGQAAAARPAAPAAPPKGARFWLEGIEGEVVGKRFPVDRFPFRIGRTRRNTLVLTDGGVSGEHCEIIARADGCAIVDRGSTNGTKVNGGRVKRAVIMDGARIQIGANVLVFRDEDESKPGVGGPAKEAEAPRGRVVSQIRKMLRPGASVAGKAGSGSSAERRAAAAAAATPGAGSARRPPAHLAETPDPDAVDAIAPLPAEEASELAGAAAGLGAGAAASAIEPPSGRAGAVAALVVAATIVAAGAVFAAVTLGRGADLGELDPAPRGNGLKNWSFEEGGPEAIADWRIHPAVVPGEARADAGGGANGRGPAIDPRGAAGGRAARLLAGGERVLELRSAAAIPLRGLDVQVRALVRGGRTHAGVAVIWESSTDPAFRLLSATDLAPRGGADFREAKGTFRPPPGADRARVALLGDNASFDRVTIFEREAQSVRAAADGAIRIEARGGLVLRGDERGLVEIERDGWPLVDRASFVLVGEGPAAALARQETALEVAPARRKERERKGEIEPGKYAGRLLAPAGTTPVAFEEELASTGDALLVRFRLAEGIEGVAPAIALYLEDAERANAMDTLARAGDGLALEVAIGAGGDELCFRPDPPARVTDVRLGRGLLLTIAAPAGARAIELLVGRGSFRERERLRAELEAAEALRKEGKLEAARRAFGRIARDFGHDPEARGRALAAERALEARAEAALAEGAAIEADIAALGVADLLAGAEERCRFVAQAYEGTPHAAKAKAILERTARAREKLKGARRVEEAAALLRVARGHLEARRYYLARHALGNLIERYPDAKDLVADARRDLEFAEKQIGGAPGAPGGGKP